MTPINYELIARLVEQFREVFGRSPEHVVRAPGRVNLLGEHVDYNDGLVMPAAIDRATYLAFSTASTRDSQLVALDFAASARFDEHSINSRTQVDGLPLPDWALYPAGVKHTLLKKDIEVHPINAVFASDVPRGSGLSSSASVEMAFMTAWQSLSGRQLPQMEKALLCQDAEMSYVGVNCGIMDQFASACGVENHLLYLDCRSLAWETIAFPEDIAIVIADTTVRRKLTGGSYNLRRAECEEAVRLLREQIPAIKSLRDVGMEEFKRLSSILPFVIEKRARHVVEEIDRTRNGRSFIEEENIDLFGRCMNESHASLRDLYEVSCLELDMMVNIAQSLKGCLGARMTGAGFGGCTVNLVNAAETLEFAHDLHQEFLEQTGINAEIYLTKASNGAEMIKDILIV